MRFTIEVYATAGDAEELLHRAAITAINPSAARRESLRLLARWKKRSANAVRLVNAEGEIVFSQTVD
jgi:hypothetical protein